MIIGILALQGAFIEHSKMLDALCIESIELRNKEDVSKPFNGLILPGGESTVMGKLLNDLDMMDIIRECINNGMPVFGTCAGMILLAKDIARSNERHLATMNISVQRNAYGRQLGSFNTIAEFGDIVNIPMTFIRAPYIIDMGKEVKALSCVNGNIVAAQQGNQLAVSFHPELTGNTTVHRYFLKLVNDCS